MGQTQQSEWFGAVGKHRENLNIGTFATGIRVSNSYTPTADIRSPDCSLQRCPGGDDPRTPTKDETDGEGVKAEGGNGYGAAGNKLHVDCSNRGACDHTTGICSCFPGFYGERCSLDHPLASGTYQAPG